jgi:hypothetical protein
MASYERVELRMIETPCCKTMLCWINPRMPNYCPECGSNIMSTVKQGILFKHEAILEQGRTLEIR